MDEDRSPTPGRPLRTCRSQRLPVKPWRRGSTVGNRSDAPRRSGALPTARGGARFAADAETNTPAEEHLQAIKCEQLCRREKTEWWRQIRVATKARARLRWNPLAEGERGALREWRGRGSGA
ncbi:Hypothetical protein CAP_7789 [Chondromyces apiculatus DSM 436]|uniref:Uncharacterized protein n=1 Tax=Chondromyces apiculatus DSM 436 TaxID=1192034 RepID=A0A017SZU2_9BACT|nr:Hypothetical protein CAP_7789 [Chondromyces apiculatus DSM 436]